MLEDGINHSNDSQLQRFIFEGDRHEHSNCVQRVWRSMSGLGSSVYLGIMGLAGAENANNANLMRHLILKPEPILPRQTRHEHRKNTKSCIFCMQAAAPHTLEPACLRRCPFFGFSLCLSRACLGKKIVLYI